MSKHNITTTCSCENTHEHERKHDEETTHLEHYCNIAFNLSSHEDATIVSCSARFEESDDRLRFEPLSLLKDTAESVEALGGIIGHIKCSINAEGIISFVSVVSANDANDQQERLIVLNRGDVVDLTVIVFGVDENILFDLVKSIALRHLQALLAE